MESSTLHHIYELFLAADRQIQTDTRQVTEGDIFFALKGARFDGNQYAAQALALGASAAIVDDPSVCVSEQYILVPDVLVCLQQLARHHRLMSQATVLAITGSNGKTTTKELIHAVLRTQYHTIATIGNLNNHIGVPLTLLRIRPETEIAIIEMGANHIGEIASYCQWALPDLGLITNVGKAHLEGFGSLAGVKQGKGELFRNIISREGLLFVWSGSEALLDLASGYDRVHTYGTQSGDMVRGELQDTPMLSFHIVAPDYLTGLYETQLVGSYNLPNALSALAVGAHFGIRKEYALRALANYQPDNSRSQSVKTEHNHIILDAYNANPSSMREAIDNFDKIDAPYKVALLGCMKEMGAAADAEHQAIVDRLRAARIHTVYLVGDEYRATDSDYTIFTDSTALHDHLQVHPIRDAHILIKGSRGAAMEAVIDSL